MSDMIANAAKDLIIAGPLTLADPSPPMGHAINPRGAEMFRPFKASRAEKGLRRFVLI
jgi:hypothetical protein